MKRRALKAFYQKACSHFSPVRFAETAIAEPFDDLAVASVLASVRLRAWVVPEHEPPAYRPSPEQRPVRGDVASSLPASRSSRISASLSGACCDPSMNLASASMNPLSRLSWRFQCGMDLLIRNLLGPASWRLNTAGFRPSAETLPDCTVGALRISTSRRPTDEMLEDMSSRSGRLPGAGSCVKVVSAGHQNPQTLDWGIGGLRGLSPIPSSQKVPPPDAVQENASAAAPVHRR